MSRQPSAATPLRPAPREAGDEAGAGGGGSGGRHADMGGRDSSGDSGAAAASVHTTPSASAAAAQAAATATAGALGSAEDDDDGVGGTKGDAGGEKGDGDAGGSGSPAAVAALSHEPTFEPTSLGNSSCSSLSSSSSSSSVGRRPLIDTKSDSSSAGNRNCRSGGGRGRLRCRGTPSGFAVASFARSILGTAPEDFSARWLGDWFGSSMRPTSSHSTKVPLLQRLKHSMPLAVRAIPSPCCRPSSHCPL
mmetsp:Transcript_106207/g.269803  ORF Transcript_106207/g.269803 Transcript_106207/m.269803 type:complete len:249 (-) Transcript_106207:877-1623(-)